MRDCEANHKLKNGVKCTPLSVVVASGLPSFLSNQALTFKYNNLSIEDSFESQEGGRWEAICDSFVKASNCNSINILEVTKLR
jgi:hypothetical protein